MTTGFAFTYLALPRSPEVVDLLNRHRDYYISLAETAQVFGPDAPRWRDVLSDEGGNLRSALGWALETDLGAALRLVGAIGVEWPLASLVDTAALEELEVRTAGAEPNLRVPFLLALAEIERNHGDLVRAEAWADEAVKLAGSSGSATLECRALVMRGSVRRYREFGALPDDGPGMEDVTRALELARQLGDRKLEGCALQWIPRGEEAAAVFNELGDQMWLAFANWISSYQRMEVGDVTGARELAERALVAARAAHDPYTESWMLARAKGDIELWAGELEPARQHYLDAVTVARRHGIAALAASAALSLSFVAGAARDLPEVQRWAREATREAAAAGGAATGELIGCFQVLAACASGDTPERAARLFGAADALCRATGRPGLPRLYTQIYDAMERAKRDLSPEAFTRAWNAGAALSRDEALREALGQPTPR
jgi:hypothetical protein